MNAVDNLRNSQLKIGDEFIGSYHSILRPSDYSMVDHIAKSNSQREDSDHEIEDDVKIGGESKLLREVRVS